MAIIISWCNCTLHSIKNGRSRTLKSKTIFNRNRRWIHSRVNKSNGVKNAKGNPNISQTYILKVLKWQLSPPTINNWINWYTSQWDVYIKQNEKIINETQISSIQFRLFSEKSYKYYRELT